MLLLSENVVIFFTSLLTCEINIDDVKTLLFSIKRDNLFNNKLEENKDYMAWGMFQEKKIRGYPSGQPLSYLYFAISVSYPQR